MTTIDKRPYPKEFAYLVEALWGGQISQNDFVKNAHQIGASVARIEFAIEELKTEDGVQ